MWVVMVMDIRGNQKDKVNKLIVTPLGGCVHHLFDRLSGQGMFQSSGILVDQRSGYSQYTD